MMKRKFLAVVLPIVGCATVVGSGFSAWYFSDTLTSGNKESNLVSLVTPEGKEGPLSVTATNDFIGGLLDELIEEDKKNTELQNLINSRILYNVRYESSKTSNNIKESTNIYIFNMMII